ncbi:MAG: hypothetical protein NTY01_16520 [Verrucomicrobia bacterium]|nr:hypothetical protein [Verrucomicrobiota bacterium]
MALKSSYDLAMERLGKSLGPERKLTDAQKKQLAEIDSVYKAKIADLELSFGDKIVAARAAQDVEKVLSLEQTLLAERQKLHDDCEAKKEKLRRLS